MKTNVLALLMAGLLFGCSAGPEDPGRIAGLERELGGGAVSTYARVDKAGIPLEVGVIISSDALMSPPTEPTDGLRCFDRDDNDVIDETTECNPSHERVLPLPDAVSRRSDMPFKWVLLHWNLMGHEPHGIYSVPHYDIHYMIEPVERIYSIAAGTCGEGVRCDAYARAKKPLPEGYMHPDFQDVDAVVPAMGNHLIDLSSHEFHGSQFTRTWIYGVYDGRVAFYEEMVTTEYLLTKPSECFPIKSPPAVGLSGYYPTQSCMRYDAPSDAYTVSIEGFRWREKTAPTTNTL